MKNYYWVIITILVCFIFCSCDNISQESKIESSKTDDNITLIFSDSDCVGQNYETIKNELLRQGFINVECCELPVLELDDKDKNGEVERISINSNDTFSKDSQVRKDSEIIIYYNVLKDIEYPYTPEELAELSAEDVKIKLIQAGYDNANIAVIPDLNPEEYSKEYVYNTVSLNENTEINKGDLLKYNSEITIYSHKTYSFYDVEFKIDFIENLFFDKYDVSVVIDNEEYCILNHGQSVCWNLNLQEGKHIFEFENNEDSSVNAEIVIDISKATNICYALYCRTDSIELKEKYIDNELELESDQVKIKFENNDFYNKNKNDVIEILKNEGFSCINEEPLYDIVLGITSEESVESVLIDNRMDYKYGDVFNNSCEVRVLYHMKQEDGAEVQSIDNSNEDELDTDIEDIVIEDDNTENSEIGFRYSILNGSHKALDKIIKEKLDYGKRFKFKKCYYINIDDEEKQELIDILLSRMSKTKSYSVDVGDIFLYQRFTFKEYDEIVEAVAYGLEKKESGETILIAIKENHTYLWKIGRD